MAHATSLIFRSPNVSQLIMSHDKELPIITTYQHYCPPGVKRVLALGTSAFIREVDESTVFKYPLTPRGDMACLEVERKLLEIIGPHEQITRLKSFSDSGLYLEHALNRNVANYMLESGKPFPSVKQQLTWC